MRRAQQSSSGCDCVSRRRAAARRQVTRGIDRRQRGGQPHFLHLRIEIHVDRPLRRSDRVPVRPQQRFARGARRGGLVIPFHVGPDQRTLIARRMDPVDPGPALGRIDGTGRAEDHDRHPVAPGVEDRHRRVHQADIGMHRHRQRLAGDLRVTLGDCHRVFFVQAEQHLRRAIAQIVDQAVMQSAEARAGIERDVRDAGRAQGFGDNIAAELRRGCQIAVGEFALHRFYRGGIWISVSNCSLVSAAAVYLSATASGTIVSRPTMRSGSRAAFGKNPSRVRLATASGMPTKSA